MKKLMNVVRSSRSTPDCPKQYGVEIFLRKSFCITRVRLRREERCTAVLSQTGQTANAHYQSHAHTQLQTGSIGLQTIQPQV